MVLFFCSHPLVLGMQQTILSNIETPDTAYRKALMHEIRRQDELLDSQDVIVSYENALYYYKKSAEMGHVSAPVDAVRVSALLGSLKQLPAPDFRGFLFLKLRRELIKKEFSLDLLYWFAHICGVVRNRCGDVVQEIVLHSLVTLVNFPADSNYVRPLLHIMSQLVGSEEFNEVSSGEAYRIAELHRIQRGIRFLSRPKSKGIGLCFWNVRRVDERVRDILVEVYNGIAANASSSHGSTMSLDIRLALCLADLRKECLNKLIPENGPERTLNCAYLEKKVGKFLAFAESSKKSNDDVRLTMQDGYNNGTDQEIITAALRYYTEEAMIDCIAAEATKMDGSRLHYSKVLEYFENLVPHSGLLFVYPLYDRNRMLTKEGARFLLLHFGYLERV